MEVPDSLSRSLIAVVDDAETVFREPHVMGDFPGDLENVTHQFIISRRQIKGCPDMLARNDQNVAGGLWIDVFYNDQTVILIDEFPGDISGNDFTEDAADWHARLLLQC